MGRPIKNSTKQHAMLRNRVKKCRKSKKSKESYGKAVLAEIQNIEYGEENTDEHENDFSQTETNDENTTYELYSEMTKFKDKLTQWAINHNIKKRAINDLLSILIIFGFTFLPKDSRTLMKTPKCVPIKVLTKGQLWYHGIKIHLEQVVHKICASINTIHLDFNFDGVELFDASNKCFWPMIASIRGIDIFINMSFCRNSDHNEFSMLQNVQRLRHSLLGYGVE